MVGQIMISSTHQQILRKGCIRTSIRMQRLLCYYECCGGGMKNRRSNVMQVSYISTSSLTKELVQDTKRFDQRPNKEDLIFGTTLSDHMLTIEWVDGSWKSPKIIPYQDLKISPAASCLHYGLQCFEGMKAYKTINNENDLRLFRPDKNMERLSNSMNRLHMPGYDFDRVALQECIAELINIDKKWIPYGDIGYSLYIRPTVIATHKYLGLSPPDSLLLYVITSPVGPYYKSGFKPIALTADTPYVRAWPGGTGCNKVGGNYASTMKAQFIAAKDGYGQVLWLWGDNDEVTEVGAMNVFFIFHNKDNKPELVTPPLLRGDILPGVTRDSILHLARTKWNNELIVSERYPTMNEIQTASYNNTLIEAFGAGTAAVVTPIGSIQYNGQDINIPTPTGNTSWTQRIWDEITGIQYGTINGPKGWSVKI